MVVGTAAPAAPGVARWLPMSDWKAGKRHRRMAAGLLACKGPRTRLPVGASALGFFVLCWLYIFPVYRLPDEKEVVQGVLLQQGRAWRRNRSAVAGFR